MVSSFSLPEPVYLGLLQVAHLIHRKFRPLDRDMGGAHSLEYQSGGSEHSKPYCALTHMDKQIPHAI